MDIPFESYKEIIPDYEDFLESIQKPLPVHLRINRLKAEPRAALESLQQRGVVLHRSIPGNDDLFVAENLRSPGNLVEYFRGFIHPQALTSCLAPLVLAPEAGSYVLDMCASPGGKTSQIAQLMQNTGVVIANELYPERHIPLAHTLARLGVLNSLMTAYQAQEFPLRDGFDFILADVPCSGEGRFRDSDGTFPVHGKNWENRRLPEVQKRIILRGFDLLKTGGVMVYATCTYNPEENESVVDFLLKNRDAEVLEIDPVLPCEPGITNWKTASYEKDIRRCIRLYPHQINSVGFFIARIGRRC